MTRDLRIRVAAPGERPAIASVLEQCGLATEEVQLREERFHVALLDDRIVGCGGVERHGECAVVCSVAVLPQYRDRGIASHLISALLMRARADGCRSAVLLTSRCPNYFARYGFSLVPAASLSTEIRESLALRNQADDSGFCMRCELN